LDDEFSGIYADEEDGDFDEEREEDQLEQHMQSVDKTVDSGLPKQSVWPKIGLPTQPYFMEDIIEEITNQLSRSLSIQAESEERKMMTPKMIPNMGPKV
jgi:hypothetical protein